MKVGVFARLTERTIPVDELARALEERGIESLWVGEHTHTPVLTEADGYHDAEMVEISKHFPAPLVLLTVAAAVTSKLRVGTSVCLVAQHDPLVLAKTVATLDLVSGGRFELGCGYGWNHTEMRNHGFAPEERRAVLREKLLAMKALWKEDVTAFSGKHVSFTASWSNPKPVQSPHPPVLIGAPARPCVIRDIVDLADGWMPSAYFAGDRLAADLRDVRRAAERAGRDPTSVQVTLLDSATSAGALSVDEFSAQRTPTGRLKAWQELSIGRVVIGVPAHERDTTWPILDEVAGLADEVR